MPTVKDEPFILPQGISIYTSTSSFSLEGDGWDEGDLTA